LGIEPNLTVDWLCAEMPAGGMAYPGLFLPGPLVTLDPQACIVEERCSFLPKMQNVQLEPTLEKDSC
jgi:hypothetical protein